MLLWKLVYFDFVGGSWCKVLVGRVFGCWSWRFWLSGLRCCFDNIVLVLWCGMEWGELIIYIVKIGRCLCMFVVWRVFFVVWNVCSGLFIWMFYSFILLFLFVLSSFFCLLCCICMFLIYCLLFLFFYFLIIEFWGCVFVLKMCIVLLLKLVIKMLLVIWFEVRDVIYELDWVGMLVMYVLFLVD